MDIKSYLSKIGVDFKIHTHKAVFTVDEAKVHCGHISGLHSKNLFLKDKKSRRFYLAIFPAHKKVDLESLGTILEDKLKFANKNDLKEILDLAPGSVSPFGLINDEEHRVKVIIDKKVWDSDTLSFHPNINTETLELKKESFHKYIASLENEHRII